MNLPLVWWCATLAWKADIPGLCSKFKLCRCPGLQAILNSYIWSACCMSQRWSDPFISWFRYFCSLKPCHLQREKRLAKPYSEPHARYFRCISEDLQLNVTHLCEAGLQHIAEGVWTLLKYSECTQYVHKQCLPVKISKFLSVSICFLFLFFFSKEPVYQIFHWETSPWSIVYLIFAHSWLYIYIYMCVYTYIYIYTHIHIYVYTHIYIHMHNIHNIYIHISQLQVF